MFTASNPGKAQDFTVFLYFYKVNLHFHYYGTKQKLPVNVMMAYQPISHPTDFEVHYSYSLCWQAKKKKIVLNFNRKTGMSR